MSYFNLDAVKLVMDSTAEIQAALAPFRSKRKYSRKSTKQSSGGSAHSAFPILLVIARHADQQDECWLSFTTIAKESLWSRRAVVNFIPVMVKAGLIKVIGQHGSGTHIYRLVVRGLHQNNLRTSANAVTDSANAVDDGANAVNGGAEIAHEVIPELLKEELKGSKSLTTTPPIRQEEVKIDFSSRSVKGVGGKEREIKSSTPPVGQEGNKQPLPSSNNSCPPQASQGTKTVAPRHAIDVATVVTGPATALAARYYEHLGHPVAHRATKDEAWPQVFTTMLDTYPYDELLPAIDWAFNIDTFWPQHLFRRSGDPVEYFKVKAEAIMNAWRGYARSQRNESKSVSSVPVPSSKLGSLWERNRI